MIATVLLARLVPFHEIGAVAYWVFLAVGAFALAAVYQLTRRRDVLLPLMLALGVIVVLLLFDAVIGTPLQFNNPLGYSPRVAGRFSGYGNLAYAALASAAVLLSGLLAHRLGGRRGALTAIGLLAVVFVVDDDRSMRESLQMVLRSVKLHVQAFASPHEFLAAARPRCAAT